MSKSLQITMMPAKEGDCLLIAYGDQQNKKYILIDGGRAWTYKNALKQHLINNNIAILELLVATHVDRDHIDGLVEFIRDSELDLNVNDVWFNTFAHLEGHKVETPDSEDDIEEFGAKMGEDFSMEIINKGWRWNRHFKGKAVEIDKSQINKTIELDEISLTLLSPDRDNLVKFVPNWVKECEDAGIVPGYKVKDYVVIDEGIEDFGPIDIEELADEHFSNDPSDANGTSIAFMLKYKNRKILLSGDTHPDLLEESLKNLGYSADNPIELDAFKVPHHGSKYNISKELLNMMKCDNYLISTNGNYFDHPDDVAIARLIKFGTEDSTLCFNYTEDRMRRWENNSWMQTYKYSTSYPLDGENGYLCLEFQVD